MKKTVYLLTVLILTFTACKSDKKNEASTEKTDNKSFVVKPEATTVKWTAYKTTDKVPVAGEFKIVEFEEKSGSTVVEALNDLSFKIPVSSLFTNDPTGTRDPKIIKHFFNVLSNPELLTGNLKVSQENAVASITMNQVTKNIPLEMTVEDERRVTLKGVIKLEDFNAQKALESLNKACFDLHKGADGVSKTWSEVAIEVNTFLREN